MRVKRYVVNSMPEALQRIRADLGSNAVIMSTKEVKSGGFLGLFSQKKIEVVAAADDSKDVSPSPSNSAQVNSAPVNSAPVKAHAPSAAVPLEAVRSTPVENSEPKDESIKQEIQQLKKLVLQIAGGGDRKAYPEALAVWEERLIKHGFKEEIVHAILTEVIEQTVTDQPEQRLDSITAEEAALLVRKSLYERLTRHPIRGIEQQTRLVQFIGPTGVGKTTTIAKLAAEQVLAGRSKVGFITSDTYRIAAIEQLRTYANILNVPLEVVNSPQDLHIAFEKLGDVDLVLMDTAGRNFRNELYVSEMSSMLQNEVNHEVILVLSLTMKYEDMRAVAENFSRYPVHKVLFTKMDETGSFGSIFNLLDEFELSLSYITTGQNVPDDICQLNADVIIDRIMEG